ncbi:MAG TPA: hypothetical protein VKG92_12295 [Flavobacteriales bacterium]|nr:hypothetical protein [Flavobacteriales bacterium]
MRISLSFAFLMISSCPVFAQDPLLLDTSLFYKTYVIFEPDSFRLSSGGGISAATETWSEGTDPKVMQAACDMTMRDLRLQGWVATSEAVDKRGKHTWELTKTTQ